MNRPAPRKSSLAGTSPLTPPPAAVAPAAASPAPDAAPSPKPVTTPTKSPKATGGEAATKSADKYPRLNYYVEDTDTAGRIRSAYMAARSHFGWRTFSDMQASAVLTLVEKIEKELNGGRHYEPIGAGAVPTGRSIE